MDDIELCLKQYEDRESLRREKFFKLVSDSVGFDGELIYRLLCDRVDKRFKLVDSYAPTYKIVNHYIQKGIDMPFEEWLYCEDAPFIVSLYNIGRIFPEFKGIAESDYQIVSLANNVYGLDLQIEYDCCATNYVYAYSLNFNSFTPIDADEILSIKKEIEFCDKYGIEHKELDEKLSSFGIDVEKLMEV